MYVAHFETFNGKYFFKEELRLNAFKMHPLLAERPAINTFSREFQ